MNEADPADETLPLSLAREIDRVCDHFERAWEAGTRPRLETSVEELPEAERPALLRALLAVELECRCREGERPLAEDYRQRFPEHLEVIDSVFQASVDHGCHSRSTSRLVPGCLVGEYQLLAEIGKGGMGIVYRALQLRVPRVVALKVIRADRLDELPPERRRVWIERFTTEARALAQLDHDHIVTVHDVGEHDGLPFYAMHYIEGTTLAEILRDGRPLPGRKAAAYLEPLARAVQHAHQRGILHRDLKPKNVLVEWASDRPCVVDFGLAKLLQGDPGPTVTGDLIGSPPYLPPEQARQPEAVSVAADVYGLGATLYHLLTGRPPFQAPTVAETLLQLVHEEPVPPRRLNPSLDRDLETICLKCLEKEPARRYTTAEMLADDLARYLRGEPVRARPPGSLGRMRRWCRRNRSLAALTVAVAASLLLAVAALILAAVEADGRANQQQRTAEEARGREQEQRRAVLLQQLLLARQEEHANGWREANLGLVKECASLGADLELRSEAAANLEGLDAQMRHQIDPLSASAIALSPTGDRLLLGGTDDWEGKPVSAAQLREGLSGRPLVARQAGAGPVAFRPSDGAALQLVARPGPTALLWDLGKQRPISTFRFAVQPGQARPVAFARTALRSAVLALAPDGSRAAAVVVEAEGEPRLAVWETGSGKRRLWERAEAEALVFSADGAWLAAGSRKGCVTVWPVGGGRSVVELPRSGAAVRCLAFSRDGRLLAAGDAGGACTIWDWQERSVQAIGRGAHYDVYAVAFSPDGTTLACAGRGPVRLYDSATGRPLLNLRSGDYVCGLSFSADGCRLATCGLKGFSPGSVHVWELEDGRGSRTLRGLSSQVARVCLSADGRRLAALSHDWHIAVWDLSPKGGLIRLLQPAPGVLADNSALVFSPDGRRLALAAGTAARLWDIETGREQGHWRLPRGLVDQLTFHPQTGELLLFRFEKPRGAATGVCLIRALGPGGARLVARLAEPYRTLYNAASAADGNCLLLEGVEEGRQGPRRTIRCLDWRTGKDRWSLPSIHLHGASASFALDPSGRLATIYPDGRDGRVQLVEMTSGRQVATFPFQPAGLSPGAEWFVTTATGTARLKMGFALHRGKGATPLLLFGNAAARSLISVSFSRDGRLLAWGNGDGSVCVCDLEQVRSALVAACLGWERARADSGRPDGGE